MRAQHARACTHTHLVLHLSNCLLSSLHAGLLITDLVTLRAVTAARLVLLKILLKSSPSRRIIVYPLLLKLVSLAVVFNVLFNTVT